MVICCRCGSQAEAIEGLNFNHIHQASHQTVLGGFDRYSCINCRFGCSFEQSDAYCHHRLQVSTRGQRVNELSLCKCQSKPFLQGYHYGTYVIWVASKWSVMMGWLIGSR